MKKKYIIFIVVGIFLLLITLSLLHIFWRRSYNIKFNLDDVQNVYIMSYLNNREYLNNYQNDNETVRLIDADKWEDLFEKIKNADYKSYHGTIKTFSEYLICFILNDGRVFAFGHCNIYENENTLNYSCDSKIIKEIVEEYTPDLIEFYNSYTVNFDIENIDNIYFVKYDENSDYLINYQSDTDTVKIIASEEWRDICNDIKQINFERYNFDSLLYSKILLCFRLKNGNVYAFGDRNIFKNGTYYKLGVNSDSYFMEAIIRKYASKFLSLN